MFDIIRYDKDATRTASFTYRLYGRGKFLLQKVINELSLFGGCLFVAQNFF